MKGLSIEIASGFTTANDGVRLYYEDGGRGETIILIHGGGLSLEWWWKQTSVLRKNFRVIAADTRGNGRSDKTPWGHRTARYAMDIREIIDDLGLHDVTVVGWSIGARTVLSYLELFRDYRLRGAVLVDEVPTIEVHDPPPEQPGPVPEDETERKRFDLRQMFETAIVSDEELDRLIKASAGNSQDQGITLGADYRAQDWRSLCPAIDLPVLIVTGGKSGAYPGCLYMAEQIPGARLVTCERSGHAPFYEEPGKFNNAISNFVTSISRWT